MNRESITRLWKALRLKIAFCVAVAIVVAATSTTARSQLGLDPCCAIISVGLQSISGLLKSVVAQPLGQIQQIEQQGADFEQQIVYPVSAINQARAMAVQAQGQFTGMRQLFQISVASATLPAPMQLEQNLLSANPGAVPAISSGYAAVYGALPAVGDAPQPVRDFLDMSDAEAQAAFKKAVELDALANLELQAAEQINQQLQSAAPGTGPMLDAQAAAWVVRADAYNQTAIAELVRLHSIELANQGARLKLSAASAANLRTNTANGLKRGGQ
jgi:hypothetical protein